MRLLCYIFNRLTVASLLLLLGTAVLWVDSYRANSQVHLLNFERYLMSLYSQSGALSIFVSSESVTSHFLFEFGRFQPSLGESLVPEPTGVLGFGFDIHHYPRGGWNLNTILPHWFLILIFTITPAIWLYKWNRRRKLAPNACRSCGYDLTGNESGVCPECGVERSSAVSWSEHGKVSQNHEKQ